MPCPAHRRLVRLTGVHFLPGERLAGPRSLGSMCTLFTSCAPSDVFAHSYNAAMRCVHTSMDRALSIAKGSHLRSSTFVHTAHAVLCETIACYSVQLGQLVGISDDQCMPRRAGYSDRLATTVVHTSVR
eukprot:jgi/Ulvmu1/4157/UM019_0136.1